MNIKSRLMVFLTTFLLSSSIFIKPVNAYSGYVGERIPLADPSVNGTLDQRTWESSDNSLVHVDANGVALIYKYFSGEVLLTCRYNYSYYSGGKKHYITDQIMTSTITCKSSKLSLNKTEITMEAGEEVELRYTNSSGYELPFSEWYTSNENVAMMYGGNAFVASSKVVGEDAISVIGIGEGQCTITCDGKNGDAVKTCKVIVVDNRWVKADIESGAVKKGTKVSLTCTKQGGTIYYTTDGSEPSKNSTQYTYPIEINSDMILKAKAYVGNEESKTSQWKYVVSSHLDGEIFRANNNEGVEIKYKVRTNSSGSVYCIVTGGSSSLRAIDKNYSGDLIIPTYAEDIVVTGIDESAFEDCKLTSVTLPKYEGLGRKFTIYKNAFKYSNIRTFTVPISNRVSIGEEAFSKCYNLETINFNHTGIEKISTKAFYDSKYIKTINSNLANPPKLPTDCFDEKVYNNAILYIPQGKYDTYKYSDWKKFKNIFEQGTQQQQIKLTASPSGGEVDKGTTVYLSTDVSDADIYYTLDGTTPSKSSYYYTAAIIINESCTLKAIAYKDGFKDSDVITEYYTVDNGSDPGDDPGDDPGNDPGPDPGKDPDTIPEGSIVIDDTNFPDVNFRKALLNMEEGADGYLTKEDIESLTYVEIVDYGVSDFKGIEFLTSLISFDCSYNNISSIDLSKNTELWQFTCYNCEKLSEVNITNNSKLEIFNCQNCNLSSLDTSNNPLLRILWLNNNQIKSLDLYNNPKLEDIGCNNNSLTLIKLPVNTTLTKLSCGGNQLTSLDVSVCSSLSYLDCDNNQLVSLILSGCSSLTTLCCRNNQLISLDTSSCSELEILRCEHNNMVSFDFSKNIALTSLSCNSNQLTSLDVSVCSSLSYLDCGTNQLTSLDVSANTLLTELSCGYNQLTSLNVSPNTLLTKLSCGSNQLTFLDVSGCSSLKELYCYSNKISSLDVSANTLLTELLCDFNQLTSLDVSNNPSLSLLQFSYNFIKGVEMDRLISSLPINDSNMDYEFRVIMDEHDGNVCTTTQVASIKAKGWKPCCYEFDSYGWVEYSGSDPSGINNVLMDRDIETPIFDLSGKKLSKPDRGINIMRTTDGKYKKIIIK